MGRVSRSVVIKNRAYISLKLTNHIGLRFILSHGALGPMIAGVHTTNTFEKETDQIRRIVGTEFASKNSPGGASLTDKFAPVCNFPRNIKAFLVRQSCGEREPNTNTGRVVPGEAGSGFKPAHSESRITKAAG
jgi:hypothetical protein